MAKRAGFCFRCEAYDAFVLQTWHGDAMFPWTRRSRRCGACGAFWVTVEVIDPASPLLAELRQAAVEMQLLTMLPPDPQLALDLISPAETEAPTWRDARTWR